MTAQVQLYRSAILSILLQRPHALWIDNYNKGYRHLMLNLDVGSFHRIDATAVVLVLFNEPPTLSSYKVPGVAGITPRVLSCTHLAKFLQCFENYQLPNLLPSSLTHKLQLYNNPLKPEGAEDISSYAADCLGTSCFSY
jgi:hypothetical protein